jgi:hypothetical protein
MISIEKISNFFKENKVNIFIILIFIILPLIFFKGILNINSVIFSSGDALDYISQKHISVEAIKNLDRVFWNRYSSCGQPFEDSYFFYPITLILDLIFPLTLAYNLQILLHYSLAGIFMFLFLNEYKLDKLASFAGGMIFMFSGLMISNKSTSMAQTIIWFPLILLFLEKYRKTKRIEFIFIASIFYSLAFFGHIQIFLYGSIVILLYVLFYTFIYKGGKNYYFLFSLTIFIVAILIDGFALIEISRGISSSLRGTVEQAYDFFSIGSLNPKLLPILIFPFIFGCKYPAANGIPQFFRWFGQEDSLAMFIYFGITTIPLLIFGFFIKNKHKYLWIFIMSFSFLLVLGKYTPLYKLMYYVPFFNMGRNPTRNWFEFGLAFSILSAWGFDYFIKLDREKIKRIVLSAIIFLCSIFSSFFIFYIFFHSRFKDNIINFFRSALRFSYFDGTDIGKVFTESIKLTNYSIYMPLIIIIATICLLVLVLFKKNKFIYILIIVFIFLDLYSYGHFDENNSKNIFIPKEKIEYSEDLKFLNEKNDLFRIFPVAELPEAYIYMRNRNIYYELDYVFGYGYTNPDFNYITILEDNAYERNPNWEESLWKESLKNNIVISMLNTKYVVLPKQDNIDEFMDSISKSFKNETAEPVLDKNLYSKAEFDSSKLSQDKSVIIISGSQNKLKFYKAPVEIKSNKDYLINFEIKKNKELDNNIHFDFSGNGYDNPNQEFSLSPDDITQEYTKISRIINSEKVPSDSNIFFRIFTNSGGEISVKDLEIHEVKRYYNYEIKYSDDNVLVLENKNVLPRFYFAGEVKSMNNLQEVKNTLWEKDIFWDYDRFDPKKITLVQDVDFNKRKFNIENANVDVIEYKNHEVILETRSDDNSFLVFSDNYNPEWKAYIDGAETKIYRTNGILKGIYIPKGTHRIKYSYTEGYFLPAAIISLSSFILIIAGTAILLFKRKKRSIN